MVDCNKLHALGTLLSQSFRCDIVKHSELHEGEPALFCEGDHQKWAHACCFNISDNAYKAMSNSSEPWICPLCNETEIVTPRSNVPKKKLIGLKFLQA